MAGIDEFLFGDISHGWRHVEILKIREAACILGWIDPAKYPNNRILPTEAASMQVALERAISGGSLPFVAAWEYHPDDWNNEGPFPAQTVDAHTHLADRTTIKVSDLVRWCDTRDIQHFWPAKQPHQAAIGEESRLRYPVELRAAIEAFEAVSNDPAATARNTPKAALLAWLKKNKPNIPNNGRERIATVANWQPTGGAPKTPG